MYLVKCSYCQTTYETDSEGNLHCQNCGAANSVEDIIRKTSGNYFKQAAEQDYDGVSAGADHRPKTELEKVTIMEKNKKLALTLWLGMVFLFLISVVGIAILGAFFSMIRSIGIF